jgi:hypothetical protein
MPARIIGKIEATDGVSWNIRRESLDHAFMAPYRRWFAHGDYEFIRRPRRVYAYWEVEPYGDKSISTPVRYAQKNWPAVVERQTNGKVLLLTTPMDERNPVWNDSGEKLTSFYLALTMMCAQRLCPRPEDAGHNFQFNHAPPLLKTDAAPPFSKYVLSSAGYSEEIRFDDRGLWHGSHLPRAGNYTVVGKSGDKNSPTHAFSVNVGGEESDLTRVPLTEIEALLGKDVVVPQDRKKSISDTLNWNEPIELFPWLMIALLFALALEGLFANRFYKSRESRVESRESRVVESGESRVESGESRVESPEPN